MLLSRNPGGQWARHRYARVLPRGLLDAVVVGADDPGPHPILGKTASFKITSQEEAKAQVAISYSDRREKDVRLLRMVWADVEPQEAAGSIRLLKNVPLTLSQGVQGVRVSVFHAATEDLLNCSL